MIFVGQDKLRDLWRHYYPGTNGIIFVVDSADKTRLNTAKEELHLLMNEHELQYATCLVLISFHLYLYLLKYLSIAILRRYNIYKIYCMLCL